jgi:hypothetical protein
MYETVTEETTDKTVCAAVGLVWTSQEVTTKTKEE